MSLKKFHTLPRHIREPASLALGGVIRDQRERRGWTLARLAAQSGMTRQMLVFIESHERLATIETLGRIGRALGVPGSTMLARAERRAARWPSRCQQCNYRCIENGRLKWLNDRRGCIRPAH